MSHPSDAFTTIVHPEVREYLANLDDYDDPLLPKMEAYCKERGFPLVGRASGRVLELLARAIGARRVFEFGSGFGYSAYFFARAVGEKGEVIGSDKDQHEIDAHEAFYAGHPLKPRISLRVGSAFDVFAATTGSFDVAFIDIHKAGYVQALEMALPRIRTGGLVVADNTLWGGKVARPAADADTRTLQTFDRALFHRGGLFSAILPVGDGLSVSLKLA